MPQAEVSLRIIQAAREIAPVIRVLARAEYVNQAEEFREAGAAIVRYDEAESAAALAEALLRDIDVPTDRIDTLVTRSAMSSLLMQRGASSLIRARQ